MQRRIPTTVRKHANQIDIPSDIPKLRQTTRSAQAPSVPTPLALAVEEREHLQLHLNLVGLDKYHFKYTDEDQGELS